MFASCAGRPEAGKSVNVIFRYDDCSAISPTDLEQKIIGLFRGHRAAITFSVIPYVCDGDQLDPSPASLRPLPPAKGEILKNAVREGTIDIALHGYSHQTNSASGATEFSGLSYAVQFERLSKGRTLLEGLVETPVATFVPPWNKYDRQTLRALEELGFSMLSPSKRGVAAVDSKLLFLPVSCEPDQLREAVHAARESADNQPVVVVMLHGYDFREVDERQGKLTFREFAGLMQWLQTQGDVRILSLGQAGKTIRDLSARRFLRVERDESIHSLMPVKLRAANPAYLYREHPALVLSLFRVGLYFVLVVALGWGLSLAAVRIYPRSNVRIRATVSIGFFLLSALLLISALGGRRVHPKRLTAAALLVGVSIGSGVGFHRRRQRERAEGSV